MADKISIEELVKAGAHFGHQTKRWNPKMTPYIYGAREGVHIFDLEKTIEKLQEALTAIKNAAKQGKGILILGTKKQGKDKVEEVAKEAGVYWVNERWLGGTITNFEQIKKSIKKLSDMKAKMQAGEYKSRTKKERLLIQREIDRLERFFGGIAEMDEVPDLLVVIDTKREIGAIKEARMKDVEIVGVVDTNSDPTLVDYPIPMNDDATRAISYVLDLVRNAILDGKKIMKRKSKTGSSSRTGSVSKAGSK